MGSGSGKKQFKNIYIHIKKGERRGFNPRPRKEEKKKREMVEDSTLDQRKKEKKKEEKILAPIPNKNHDIFINISKTTIFS